GETCYLGLPLVESLVVGQSAERGMLNGFCGHRQPPNDLADALRAEKPYRVVTAASRFRTAPTAAVAAASSTGSSPSAGGLSPVFKNFCAAAGSLRNVSRCSSNIFTSRPSSRSVGRRVAARRNASVSFSSGAAPAPR